MDSSVHRTIVAFGMTLAGTTPLIKRYVNDTFDTAYDQTIFHKDYSTITDRRGITVRLTIVDTPGEFVHFRKQAYETYTFDAALLCCPTDQFPFLQRLDWMHVDYIAEFHEFHPHVPVILVGTKIDKEPVKTPREKRTSIKTGQQLADKIGAVCYMECSALTKQGVREVFDKAIDVSAPKMVTTLERRGRKYLGIPKLAKIDDDPIDSTSLATKVKI